MDKMLNRILKSIQLRLLNHRIKRIDLTDDNKIKYYLSKLYFVKTGRKLNWDGDRYTEKMQRFKLTLRGKGYEKYVDKIEVRDFIKREIGEKYLIPILKIWNHNEVVDLNSVSAPYVLKTNHGAGMNLIIATGQEILHSSKVDKLTKKWLNTNYCLSNGFEFQYYTIQPKLYAEEFMKDNQGDMLELKFLCFDGEPFFCIVEKDRFGDHRRNIYDIDWNLQDWNLGSFKNFENSIDKPAVFDEAVILAKKLSKTFSHARIDFYIVNNTLKFSEITLTPGSGFSTPTTDNANFLLGRLWKI